ncbi:hypothetical protein E4U50_000723 [Claviceps purpurea]|nr:hypothetical protein E4U50_000723 [Claviceps purpurea]
MTLSLADMGVVVTTQKGAHYSALLLLLVISIAIFRALTKPKTSAPLFDPPGFFEFSATRRKKQALHGGQSLLERSEKAYPGTCFRIMTDFGEVTMLPLKYVNEVRNDERFDLGGWSLHSFPENVRGLDAFRSRREQIAEVSKRQLTKYLSTYTQPLNEETALALSEALTEDQDWHTISLKHVVLHLTTRISSRIFLGKELCRNEAWLKVSREYAVAAFMAVRQAVVWPPPLRGLISRFMPWSRRAVSLIEDARRCMAPVLERRQRERASGNYIPYHDAIEWLEASSIAGKDDPVLAQLALSALAIHTTADLLSQAVGDLAVHHEFVEPLRDEITECLAQDGWERKSLYNMKLLDSCIKESQRMKPLAMISMGRRVETDVTLSDGTFLPKGSLTAFSCQRRWDPTLYANASQWDGARFFNKRKEKGQEQTAQLVATSPDHMAFGYGRQACPGRFFAASVTKIVLAHLLLKYDVRLHDREPQTAALGFTLSSDPSVKVDVRRRKEGVDFAST